jgi:hypothetical protein
VQEWLPNNERAETQAERADRNFSELLQEFRVSQQGIQVLFAFLLTLPFMQRFHEVTLFQQWVYVVSLISAAVGTVLFIAPVSHHRILFQQGLKDQIVQDSARYLRLGLVSVLVSMLSAVFVVLDVVFGWLVGTVFVAAGLVSTVYMWFILPLRYRRKAAQARLVVDDT